MISSIGTYSKKIRIWKMGENSSPWTKSDPLTTNIFWIYFSSLDKIKWNLLLIINLNTNVMLEAKYVWNATKISKLQEKFETFIQNMARWCWVPLINSFYFVTVLPCVSVCEFFLVINLSTVAVDESFNSSNSLS